MISFNSTELDLNDCLKDLESRISVLEYPSRDPNIQYRLKNIEDKLQYLETKLNEISDVSDLEYRIGEVESFDDRISDLETRLEDVPDFSEVENRIDDLETEQNGVADITTRLTAAEVILAELRLEQEAVKRTYASFKQPEVLDSPFVS